jgi:hypothetical protein
VKNPETTWRLSRGAIRMAPSKTNPNTHKALRAIELLESTVSLSPNSPPSVPGNLSVTGEKARIPHIARMKAILPSHRYQLKSKVLMFFFQISTIRIIIAPMINPRPTPKNLTR